LSSKRHRRVVRCRGHKAVRRRSRHCWERCMVTKSTWTCFWRRRVRYMQIHVSFSRVQASQSLGHQRNESLACPGWPKNKETCCASFIMQIQQIFFDWCRLESFPGTWNA
jgi:hypothetical protein